MHERQCESAGRFIYHKWQLPAFLVTIGSDVRQFCIEDGLAFARAALLRDCPQEPARATILIAPGGVFDEEEANLDFCDLPAKPYCGGEQQRAVLSSIRHVVDQLGLSVPESGLDLLTLLKVGLRLHLELVGMRATLRTKKAEARPNIGLIRQLEGASQRVQFGRWKTSNRSRGALGRTGPYFSDTSRAWCASGER